MSYLQSQGGRPSFLRQQSSRYEGRLREEDSSAQSAFEKRQEIRKQSQMLTHLAQGTERPVRPRRSKLVRWGRKVVDGGRTVVQCCKNYFQNISFYSLVVRKFNAITKFSKHFI